MQWKFLPSIFISLCLFSFAEASVVINEIAWMGTTNSSTDEWVELRNTSATAVDLFGWSLRAVDGSPLILLSGVISGNGYYLIERTDDSTVPGMAADLVVPFGNGLSNSGETLQLFDSADALMDSVVGGEGWTLIGGDSVTKFTAQKTSAGWMTGESTPRAANQVVIGEILGVSTTTENTTTATSIATNSAAGVSSSRASLYPRSSILVDAGADKRGFVGFPVVFVGSSTGLYNEPIEYATYRWNFGDGSTADTRIAEHTYLLPGEYVVTLEVFWSKYREQDRMTATVVNPEVTIGKVVSGESGYIELQNKTTREINLSGWTVRDVDSSSVFTFPHNSVVLAGKYFLLPNTVSGHIYSSHLMLNFPNNKMSDEWVTEAKQAEAEFTERKTQSTASLNHAPLSGKTSVPKNTMDTISPNTKQGVTATNSAASVVLWGAGAKADVAKSGTDTPFNDKVTLYLGLTAFALLLFAGIVMYKSRNNTESVDEEYAIIEDIIESTEK